jgi:predicted enzyme related to lactoylglutathione lyase
MSRIGALTWMHVFIDVPPAAAGAARAFWALALRWPLGPSWDGHPEFTTLVPPQGDPYVHIQEVGDEEPRVHVDVVVDDMGTARDALVGLGAQTGPHEHGWQVMSSPGGLPFCLCRNPSGGTRPPGTLHDRGHRSRLAQVCIDVPADRYDRELMFWESLTGWHTSHGGRSEFTDLVGPPEASLRILMQRLGGEDEGTATRAHIDLGSDDIDAEVQRLTELGATFVERFEGWAVMVDPAGMTFCVTGKPPT